jgi:CheY-like chemotaxis protein
LRFPRIAAPASDPVAIDAEAGAGASSSRILVVDDEAPIRSMLKLMLQSGGHHVEDFASGEQALERLAKGDDVDLVILDQNMPGLSGIETMQRIRLVHPGMAVMISSGQLDLESNPQLRSAGVRVLAKPFDMPELFEMVKQVLGALPIQV